jgi:L-lysine 2,3-aminomutase
MASKESGLEVNADKTKYMVVSRDQNAGRGHNMKIDYRSIEMVEEFKYLGTTLTNQHFIQEINDCFPLLHNLLSSSLVSKKN